MANGDLYEIKVIGSSGTQAVLNMYHYLQTGGAGGAPQLVPTFEVQVQEVVEQMLHGNYTRLGIEGRDKVNATDFYVDPSTRYGTFVTSGNQMPLHDALSFTYRVTRLDARSGGKRFGPYGEVGQDAGAITGGMFARILAAEAVLENTISDTSGNSWRPVVFGKRTGSPGMFSNPLSGVQFFGFTTQNGRKFYTGPGF